MAWCLIRSEERAFRDALTSKKLDPFKLADMSSEERRAEFSKYVSEENAQNINSLFESKLLLQNQINGFKTWAEKTLNLKPAAKRDLLTKIDRLTEIGVLQPADAKSFMEDLAKSRLGLGITFEEAKTINQFSEERVKAQDAWKEKIKTKPEWTNDPQKTRNQWLKDETRLDYGIKQVAMEKYVNSLKLEAQNKRTSFRDNPVRAISEPIKKAPVFLNGLFKSIMASIDDSFFGRQGIKNLYGDPAQKRIWTRNFVKSFGDLASGLRRGGGEFDTMDMIKADIYSRPNAVNGKYKAGGYGLDVFSEEPFPTSLPEKVPGLGRLFRASETAFNGGAARMRADLADLMISRMESYGINTLDPKQARPVGDLVGSLTGRGNIGRLNTLSEPLNFLMWSPKFLKANLDSLFAPATYALSKVGAIDAGTEGKQFARKSAAVNTVSMVAHVAGILTLAKLFNPDSVEEDPRSTNFGKIKIFGNWTDITGGMGGLSTLAAKIVPTMHDGQWGNWQKSSAGNWTNLSDPKYGQPNLVDTIVNAFFLNKLSPFASIVRDRMRNEMFGGEAFNLEKSIIRSVIPLSIQNINQVKDKGFAATFGAFAAEMFGFGTSTYEYKADWSSSTSQVMKNFRSQVGDTKFDQANDSYNHAYNAWKDQVTKDPRYQALSDEAKAKLDSDAKDAIKNKILKEYGYKEPVKQRETVQQIREKEQVKLLKPTSSLIDGLNNVISQVNLIPEVQAASGERMVKTLQLLDGDHVEITYTNGDFKNIPLDKFVDSNNGLGKILNDVGTALHLPELNLSEKAGYLNREEKLAVFNKRLEELQNLTGKKPVEVKGTATEASPTPVEQKPQDTTVPPPVKAAEADMSGDSTTVENKNPKAAPAAKAHPESIQAIDSAATKYSVRADLLKDVSFAESSLNPTPPSTGTSSAGGLFQFLDGTWKGAMKQLGLPEDTPKTDPKINAQAATLLISKRQLSRWNESLWNWGQFYTPEEVMQFYPKTYFPPEYKPDGSRVWPENWTEEQVNNALKNR